jgi:hypothetical protein
MTMSTHTQDSPKYQDDIDALRLEITHLERDIRDAVADADGEHDNEDYISVLCQRRDEAQTKLKDIEAAGESGWADLKYGLRNAWVATRNRLAKIVPH